MADSSPSLGPAFEVTEADHLRDMDDLSDLASWFTIGRLGGDDYVLPAGYSRAEHRAGSAALEATDQEADTGYWISCRLIPKAFKKCDHFGSWWTKLLGISPHLSRDFDRLQAGYFGRHGRLSLLCSSEVAGANARWASSVMLKHYRWRISMHNCYRAQPFAILGQSYAGPQVLAQGFDSDASPWTCPRSSLRVDQDQSIYALMTR